MWKVVLNFYRRPEAAVEAKLSFTFCTLLNHRYMTSYRDYMNASLFYGGDQVARALATVICLYGE